MTAPEGWQAAAWVEFPGVADTIRVDQYRAEVKAVIATLRQVAGWGDASTPDTLLGLAEQLTAADWQDRDDLAGLVCPMCEEIDCDGGCPLEHIRVYLESGGRL